MDELKRITQVIHVFEKYGLADTLAHAGMQHHLSFRKRHVSSSCKDIPLALRTACEALGGIFLKLIIFLASRPDLVPLEYVKEFSKAKDSAKPVLFNFIAPLIEEVCDAEAFEYIATTPFSSTTITQSYRARLKDGEEVVVKVVKPGIKKQFSQEMPVLEYAVAKLHKNIPWHWNSILEEFEKYLTGEFNLLLISQQNVMKSSEIVVPKIFWELSNPEVLVRQFLPGKILKHVQEPTKQIIPRMLGACALSKGFFPLFTDQVILLPNGKVGLLRSGVLGKKELESLRAIVSAIQHKKIEVLYHALALAGVVTEKTNCVELNTSLNSVVHELPNETRALAAVFELCLTHNLLLPSWLAQVSSSLTRLQASSYQEFHEQYTNKLCFAFLAGIFIVVAALVVDQGPMVFTLPLISVISLFTGIIFTVLLCRELFK